MALTLINKFCLYDFEVRVCKHKSKTTEMPLVLPPTSHQRGGRTKGFQKINKRN